MIYEDTTPREFSGDVETVHTQSQKPLLDQEGELYNNYGSAINNLTTSVSNNVEALIDETDSDGKLNEHTTLVNELRFISKNSCFLIVTFLLQYSLTVFATFFVSRLGSYELGAISLSTTFFYITGPSIVNGASSCLDTLCSQSYSAKNYRLMSLYIQRFASIMICALVPMFCVWHSAPIWLSYLVPDPITVQLTSKFLRIASFGAPALMAFEIGKRTLQAQGIFNATFWILLIIVPINCGLNYLLLWNESTKIGFIGAPIVLVTSYYLMAILLYLYIIFINGSQFWTGFELQNCFRNWGSLIRLAIPGIIMIISEALAFELLTFMSSQFGVAGLASQSVVSLMASLAFQLPFSMAVCSSTRIAHYIGVNYKNSASTTARAALMSSLMAGAVNFSWIFFGRFKIADVFTEDPEVRKLVVQAFPIVALIQTFDCINVLSAGCLRGQGRQRIGSMLSFISYYIIGTPLELALGFYYEKGVMGLWCGLAVGVGFLTVAEFLCVLFSDWDAIYDDFLKRNEED